MVTFLNDDGRVKIGDDTVITEDEFTLVLENVTPNQVTKIRLSGICLETTKKTDPGDVATITVSSSDFDGTTKLEVAKMVEEAVTYTVEDDDLPVIWAGKDYADENDTNTLEVAI